MSNSEGTTAALESATPILTRIRHSVRELVPHRSGAGLVIGPLIVHFEKTSSQLVRDAFDLGRESIAYRFGYDLSDDKPSARPNLRVVR